MPEKRPDGTFEEYHETIEATEPLHNRDNLPHFGVRRETTEHRKVIGSRDRTIKKTRYYVVDNHAPEVIYISEWDIPHDPNSDGVKDYARGLARGLRLGHDDSTSD